MANDVVDEVAQHMDSNIKYYCRVTNCSPNPKDMGYKPNKPNTINL